MGDMTKRNRWVLVIVLVCPALLCAGAGRAPAQLENKPACELHAPASDRPTIGLVLGGGGARGPAHIGVLKVLREMRVPVDYVAGTSMGAVIGALFSLGMTPEEIETQILGIDWDDLFSDPPDRLQRTYRRKQDDRTDFLPLEFGFTREAILTNRGLIAGQKLSFAFADPRLATSGYQSFDELAYPFRAVAADLHSGEVVVLHDGNLLQAVRASMSIPGLFPPVRRDGRQLIDGGVIDNLPVDVARAMGADIVIAVDVGNVPQEADEGDLGSIPGILSQSLIIQSRHNTLIQMQDADIVIQVPLDGLSFQDFSRVGETIAPGIGAARAVQSQLAPLALGRDEYAEHLAAHRPSPTVIPIVDRIDLLNTSPAADSAVRRLIRQRAGQPLDLAQLKIDLAAIYDFGVFELVDFQVSREHGRTVLKIIASGSSYAPYVFKAALNYSGGQRGKSEVSARLRCSWMEMNRFGGEWRNDLLAGRISRLQSEFRQPLGWSRVPFLSFGGSSEFSARDYFDQEKRLGEYNLTENAATFDLGSRLGNWGEARLGLEYGFLKTRNRSGLGLEEFRGWRGGYTSFLGIDILDDPHFPTKGFESRTSLFLGREDFGRDLHYSRLETSWRGVVSRGGHTFQLSLSGGSDLGTELPQFEEFTLGGLYRLSGYLDQQLRGRHYGLGTIGWYHEVLRGAGLFSPSYYLGAGLEAGNAWADRNSARWDDLRYCLNLSLMVRTALGPIVLAYGHGEAGNNTVYLKMGTGFLPF